MRATTVWWEFSAERGATKRRHRRRSSGIVADARLRRLAALAFLSGAAALIYETVWFQLLELVIGSTAVSLGVLLAIFMGGTCAGSLAAPRMLARSGPRRLYVMLELAIGLAGVAQLALVPLAGSLYLDWAGSAAATGVSNFALRGAMAAICLLVPTFAMGATLPVLAKVAEASQAGWLYTANITGGVAGCLLAGFYLLRLHDAATASFAAAGVNLLAVIAAAFWIRKNATTSAPTANVDATVQANRRVYLAIALSGFCALAGESVWTKMLSLLFGASVYTFSIVLAVFLTGLGVGSALGSWLAGKVNSPRAALGWCQVIAMGAIGWAGFALAAWMPYQMLSDATAANIGSYFLFDTWRALVALIAATIVWGASFPLALAAAKEHDAARAMSRVYSANTLGAIAGALVASLALIPAIGSPHTEQVMIAVAAVAGLMLLWRGGNWRDGMAVVAVAAAASLAVKPLPGVLIAHGRYAASWVGKGEIVYAAEGMNSPVAVTKFASGATTFHVAGKIQASSIPRDMRLQRMLGHLTTMIPRHPRRVLVIGCGAGVTAGAVAIDPAVERVTIVEIEPLVPRAADTWFHAQNFGVVRNPKVRLRIDDGRHFLLTTNEQFDAITIDPLDPWVKGAASLYTSDFYRAMRRHLRPGGVVTMYIQLFETTREAVRSSLATFFEVFPNGTVWGNPYQGKGHDMVLFGQAEPTRINLDAMELRYAPLADSLAEVGFYSPEELFATYAGGGEDLMPWLKGAAINTDRNLRMQYLAGLGLNRDDSAAIYSELLRYRRIPEAMFSGSAERVNSMRMLLARQ